MKHQIFQFLSLTLFAVSSSLAAASLLQWIQLDLALAFSLFTFAGAIEICREQYAPANLQRVPRLYLQKTTQPEARLNYASERKAA